MTRRSVENLVCRTLIVAAMVAGWELIVYWGIFDSRVLAPPSDVVPSLPEVVTSPGFGENVRVTLSQTFTAFALSSVLGGGLGIASARFPVVRKAFIPFVALANSIPLILFYPVFIIVLGLGNASIVAVTFVFSFAVITLNTMEGLLGVPTVYVDVGRSFGASPVQQFIKVSLPAARRVILSGLRTGLLFSFISVLSAQYVLSGSGIGYQLKSFYDTFRTGEMYALAVLITVTSVLLDFVLTSLESRYVPGEKADRSHAAVG